MTWDPERVIKHLFKRVAWRERLNLYRQELCRDQSRVQSDEIKIFNFDLHISVVWDIRSGMLHPLTMTSWSGSNHNHIPRPDLPNPDPVSLVNQQTWERLSPLRARLFATRYGHFLAKFHGFLVTYPPGFFTLFTRFQKPILAIAATRFDYPFSRSPKLRRWFHQEVIRCIDSGQLTLVANNRADADYMNFFLGREISVVPSLCDYVAIGDGRQSAEPKAKREPLFIQGSRFSRELNYTLAQIGVIDVSKAYPQGYSWADLSLAPYVFTVPYNISTMTLFELSTLGVPVVIPNDEWLREMALSLENGALSEIYFPNEIQDESFLEWIKQESGDPSGLSWWLDRADFANADLMPNVTRVSKEEFRIGFAPEPVSREAIEFRNRRLFNAREALVDAFAKECSKKFKDARSSL